jgi:exonuclease VII small subunit
MSSAGNTNGIGGNGTDRGKSLYAIETARLHKELDKSVKEYEIWILQMEETNRRLAAAEEDLKNEPPEAKRQRPNQSTKKLTCYKHFFILCALA